MTSITEHQILLFFLMLVRFSGVFLSAPVFSFKGVPLIYKIGLAGLLAFILFPMVDRYTGEIPLNLISTLILVFQELMVGVSIGLVLIFVFAGVQLAGEYVGIDMGFYMAQEFDPSLNQQISVITNFKNLTAMLIFLLINGHHFLIEALAYSYRVVPVGEWHLTSLALHRIMRISAEVFIIGLKISAPAFVTLFLTSIAMSIIARALPQMNIFFVGFPLRIFMGFLSLIISMPLLFYVFSKLINSFETDVMNLLKVL